MIHWWEPLGRLLLPEPITPEQRMACAHLVADARAAGGFVEVHNNMTREGRVASGSSFEPSDEAMRLRGERILGE